MELLVKVTLAIMAILPWHSSLAVVDIHILRKLAAENNVSCILIFGYSSVDHLILATTMFFKLTTMKGNFPPYGKNFFDIRPTRRFSNGGLATNFIGFVEVSKGCCGTGTIEYGDTCKGMSTCSNPDKYVFWDAVHPTAKMYKIIADEAIETITREFISQHSQIHI